MGAAAANGNIQQKLYFLSRFSTFFLQIWNAAAEKKVKIIQIIKQAFALALLDTHRAEWVNYGTSAFVINAASWR